MPGHFDGAFRDCSLSLSQQRYHISGGIHYFVFFDLLIGVFCREPRWVPRNVDFVFCHSKIKSCN